MQQQRTGLFILLILGLLTAFGPLSIDMYLPAFPAIAKGLGVPIATVQLSLASFFIGISAGQLITGPLSDRFGRKIPLAIGLSVYVIASIGCMFTHSIEVLIALRLLQGLGGSSGQVIARAMVRDLYTSDRIAHVFSILMLIMGIAPIVAPSIGGFIITHYNWRVIFAVLGGIGVFAFLGNWLVLPESKKADPSLSMTAGGIARQYFRVLQSRQFVKYALIGTITDSGLFAYISGSPFVLMKLYGVSGQYYGWIFGLNAIGLIGCGQLNRLMLKKYSSGQIVSTMVWVQLLAGLSLIIGILLHIELIPMLLLVFIYVSTLGFLLPNTTALSLVPFKKNAGSASALLGALTYITASLTAAIVSAADNGTAMPMAATMFICALVSLLILAFFRYRTENTETDL
jgi:DHA1 family bicyclomycin/chloramphenicol resistance-like MFS transporter